MKLGTVIAAGLSLVTVALVASTRRASAASPTEPKPKTEPEPCFGASAASTSMVEIKKGQRFERNAPGPTDFDVITTWRALTDPFRSPEGVLGVQARNEQTGETRLIRVEPLGGNPRFPTLFRICTLDPIVLTSTGLSATVERAQALASAAQKLAAERAFLTGEDTSSTELSEIINQVSDAFARMADYYAKEWYPKNIGVSRPDLSAVLTHGSHYRPFDTQAGIVRGVLQGLGITQASSDVDVQRALLQSLTTRSIPGFSRHHWGTEIDTVSTDASAWKPGGPLTPLIPFMQNEAPRFGFYNPYREGAFPNPSRPHYNSEPWHLSYYPIAAPLRERWLSEVNMPALLERVAIALSPVANIDTLRRVLPTLDLPSYQGNVVPPPAPFSPAERDVLVTPQSRFGSVA